MHTMHIMHTMLIALGFLGHVATTMTNTVTTAATVAQSIQPGVFAGAVLVALFLILLGLVKPRWLANLLTHLLQACEQGIEWCARTAQATLHWGHDWGRDAYALRGTWSTDEIDEIVDDNIHRRRLSMTTNARERGWGDTRTVWTGFIVISRCAYVALAAYLLLAAYSMDFGRACLVQLQGDCAVQLPIDTGTANAGLWFLGIAFFGSLLAEALDWYPPQLHLVPDAKHWSRVVLGIYATLGTLVGMSGAVLLAVIAAVELQHQQWPSGVITVSLLQAILVNGAMLGCAVALIFGIGGLIALVLYLLQAVFEVLRFVVGLLVRLVQREPSIGGEPRAALPSVDRRAARAAWSWDIGRGIARIGRGLFPLVRRYGAEQGLAGYAHFDPKRLYDAPAKGESRLDFSPTLGHVQRAQEQVGTGGAERVIQQVLAERVGELVQRVRLIGQPDGDVLFLVDAEDLERVVPALIDLHRRLPEHRLLPIVRLPARGASDGRVARGLDRLNALHGEGSILAPLPLDPRAPFVLSAQRAGEEGLDRLLAGAFAGLIAAPIQDREQPTFGELVARAGYQWPSVGIATMSVGVPKGRAHGLVRTRGYGDLQATISQSLQLAEQLMTDPDLRTTQTPLAACGQPVAVLFIAPIPLTDRSRWRLFREGISRELTPIAPSAEPIFVSGGGVPAESATTDPYHVQVATLFGLPFATWADAYAYQVYRQESADTPHAGPGFRSGAGADVGSAPVGTGGRLSRASQPPQLPQVLHLPPAILPDSIPSSMSTSPRVGRHARRHARPPSTPSSTPMSPMSRMRGLPGVEGLDDATTVMEPQESNEQTAQQER